jgi:transcriptional regulator with XRE-family HTH domain
VGAQQATTDFNHLLGANVVKVRKASGLSQADLAALLTERGFSFQQPMVGKVERGERPLKADELVAIAEILDVKPAALLEEFSTETDFGAAMAQLRNASARIEVHRHEIKLIEEEIKRHETLTRDAERRLAELGAVKHDDGEWTIKVTSSITTTWNVHGGTDG